MWVSARKVSRFVSCEGRHRELLNLTQLLKNTPSTKTLLKNTLFENTLVKNTLVKNTLLERRHICQLRGGNSPI